MASNNGANTGANTGNANAPANGNFGQNYGSLSTFASFDQPAAKERQPAESLHTPSEQTQSH